MNKTDSSMKYLSKTLSGIGIIILIGILKIVLFNFFPVESPFIYNFLSFAQLITLLWTMLSLIPRLARLSLTTIVKVILIIFLLGTPQLVLMYYLSHPEKNSACT